jgi:hypothetical protein
MDNKQQTYFLQPYKLTVSGTNNGGSFTVGGSLTMVNCEANKYYINLYLKDKLMLRVAETFTDFKKAEKLVKELEKDNFGGKFEIKIEEVK